MNASRDTAPLGLHSLRTSPPRPGVHRLIPHGISVAAALVTVSLVTAACSSTPVTVTNTAAPKPLASGSWPYSNDDLSNTRDAAGSTITSANVSRLKQAWTFHITGPAAAGVSSDGALAANPIVVNGVVYIQDLDANVYALALATGKLKWEYQVNTPMKTGPGPDGVAVVGGTVYGVTPTTVFALDAATGRKIWVNSQLLSKGQGTFEIQPQVADGRVYLASAYGSGPGGGVLSRTQRGERRTAVEIQYCSWP